MLLSSCLSGFSIDNSVSPFLIFASTPLSIAAITVPSDANAKSSLTAPSIDGEISAVGGVKNAVISRNTLMPKQSQNAVLFKLLYIALIVAILSILPNSY